MKHAQFEDAYAAAMMATAAVERRRAADRDGYAPGGMPQCKRFGAQARKPSPAALAALALIEAEPRLRPNEIAARTGLSASRVRDLIREKLGPGPRGCRPGEGGAQRTPASIEAERLIREGKTAREATEVTGLSLAQAHRLARAIRDERDAA